MTETPQATIADLPGWPCPTRVRDIPTTPDSWGWISVSDVSRPLAIWYDELGALWVNGDVTPRYRHLQETNSSPGAIVYWTPEGIGVYIHPKSYEWLPDRSRTENTPAECWLPVVAVGDKPPKQRRKPE